jgi:hypothetical protein
LYIHFLFLYLLICSIFFSFQGLVFFYVCFPVCLFVFSSVFSCLFILQEIFFLALPFKVHLRPTDKEVLILMGTEWEKLLEQKSRERETWYSRLQIWVDQLVETNYFGKLRLPQHFWSERIRKVFENDFLFGT